MVRVGSAVCILGVLNLCTGAVYHALYKALLISELFRPKARMDGGGGGPRGR